MTAAEPARSPLTPWGILFSVVLAYPIGGALYAITRLIEQAIYAPEAFSNIPADLLFFAVCVIVTPLCLGFIPILIADAGDQPVIDVYPWIVPSAIVLLFARSRGWLSRKR